MKHQQSIQFIETNCQPTLLLFFFFYPTENISLSILSLIKYPIHQFPDHEHYLNLLVKKINKQSAD